MLRLAPGHVKALFRRAQARIELAQLDDAEHGTDSSVGHSDSHNFNF